MTRLRKGPNRYWSKEDKLKIIKEVLDGKSSYEVVDTSTNKTGRARTEILYTATEADAGRYIMIRFTGVGDVSISLNNAKLTVLDNDANVAFGNNTARSIRAEGTVDGKYQSAGLRFRVNVNRALAEGKQDIGFVVVPTSKINSGEKWYEVKADGTLTNPDAKMVGGCKNKIYAQYNGDVKTVDFQLVVTGLTKKDQTENLKDLELTAVLFVLDNEGNYTYYYVNTTSYNEVKAVYAANGTTVDSNNLLY